MEIHQCWYKLFKPSVFINTDNFLSVTPGSAKLSLLKLGKVMTMGKGGRWHLNPASGSKAECFPLIWAAYAVSQCYTTKYNSLVRLIVHDSKIIYITCSVCLSPLLIWVKVACHLPSLMEPSTGESVWCRTWVLKTDGLHLITALSLTNIWPWQVLWLVSRRPPPHKASCGHGWGFSEVFESSVYDAGIKVVWLLN